MKKFIRKFIRFFCKWLFISILTVCAFSAVLVGSLRWIDPPTSRFIERYEASSKRSATQTWVDFDKIAWHLP